jgi:hypothetical protein
MVPLLSCDSSGQHIRRPNDSVTAALKLTDERRDMVKYLLGAFRPAVREPMSKEEHQSTDDHISSRTTRIDQIIGPSLG